MKHFAAGLSTLVLFAAVVAGVGLRTSFNLPFLYGTWFKVVLTGSEVDDVSQYVGVPYAPAWRVMIVLGVLASTCILVLEPKHSPPGDVYIVRTVLVCFACSLLATAVPWFAFPFSLLIPAAVFVSAAGAVTSVGVGLYVMCLRKWRPSYKTLWGATNAILSILLILVALDWWNLALIGGN